MLALVNLKAILAAKPPYAMYIWMDRRYKDERESDRKLYKRLREPIWRIYIVDPIKGRYVIQKELHASLKLGDLTLYFENDNTKKEYLKLSDNHKYRE